MTSFKTFLFQILVVSAFVSCNNVAKKQEASSQNAIEVIDSIKQIAANNAAIETSKEAVLSLSAMFVDFTLGDAEHYTFKDKSGKMWDFGGCVVKNFTFSEELPESEANTTNQGFGSNKALQKKWFDLKYVIRDQPQYQDGPMAKVSVILEATMQK